MTDNHVKVRLFGYGDAELLLAAWSYWLDNVKPADKDYTFPMFAKYMQETYNLEIQTHSSAIFEVKYTNESDWIRFFLEWS